jgi:hypothetical protein
MVDQLEADLAAVMRSPDDLGVKTKRTREQIISAMHKRPTRAQQIGYMMLASQNRILRLGDV